MDISELISQYEAAKAAVEPIISERRMVLPIYRVEEDGKHFIGDGFFFSSNDNLDWKIAMSGMNMRATPENLLESYRFFKDKNISMESALEHATKELTDWYDTLIKGDYTLPDMGHEIIIAILPENGKE